MPPLAAAVSWDQKLPFFVGTFWALGFSMGYHGVPGHVLFHDMGE